MWRGHCTFTDLKAREGGWDIEGYLCLYIANLHVFHNKLVYIFHFQTPLSPTPPP
jgi:hypothetical protein